jgi:ferredoxin
LSYVRLVAFLGTGSARRRQKNWGGIDSAHGRWCRRRAPDRRPRTIGQLPTEGIHQQGRRRGRTHREDNSGPAHGNHATVGLDLGHAAAVVMQQARDGAAIDDGQRRAAALRGQVVVACGLCLSVCSTNATPVGPVPMTMKSSSAPATFCHSPGLGIAPTKMRRNASFYGHFLNTGLIASAQELTTI